MAFGDPRAKHLVSTPGYVADPEVIDEHWDQLLSIYAGDRITQKMLAMRAYELSFGVIKHGVDKSKITLATMTESADVYKGSPLELTILKLLRLKLPKVTGMSIKELMDLPTYELKMYIQQVVKANEIEREEDAQAAAKAAKEGKAKHDHLRGFDIPDFH